MALSWLLVDTSVELTHHKIRPLVRTAQAPLDSEWDDSVGKATTRRALLSTMYSKQTYQGRR